MCDSLKNFNFVDHLYRDLSGYRCVKELGAGGFGTTYLFTSGKNKIVVKAILPQHTGRSDVLDEVRILEKIEPSCKRNNVLCYNKVYNYEDGDKKGVFIITEYLKGMDMFDYYYTMKFNQFRVKKLLGHIKKFLRAISYIHEIGLIHYDIKPSNVMITQNNLKLIDFGLAKTTDDFKTIMPPSGGTPGFVPSIKTTPGVPISFEVAKWFDYYAFFRSLYYPGNLSILDYTLGIPLSDKLNREINTLRLLFKKPTYKNYKQKIRDITKIVENY